MNAKSSLHQSGKCVGVEKEGKLFKGIATFMVVGLRQSIPFTVQSISEVTFNVKSLADITKGNIDKLITIVCFLQGIVADSH